MFCKWPWIALWILLPFIQVSASERLDAKSGAYPGHGFNQDQENVVAKYPEMAGTIIDDCQLCHLKRIAQTKTYNSCSACHAAYKDQGFQTTLNEFGTQYAESGRDATALDKIASADADGDLFSNAEELRNACSPADKSNHPKSPVRKSKTLKDADIRKLKRHKQFLLLNATKSKDFYAEYEGVLIEDLLKESGFDISKIEAITIYASDGYCQDFFPNDIHNPFPESLFYSGYDNPQKTQPCEPWVQYPAILPGGIEEGKPIPGPVRLILADSRSSARLTPMSWDAEGHLQGEGPYRLIMPQRKPTPPDQSSKRNDPACLNPHDDSIHHNAGDCIRGVVAIEVHSSVPGFRPPDWKKESSKLLKGAEILVY